MRSGCVVDIALSPGHPADRDIYSQRNRIARFLRKLKQCRANATRCDKHACKTAAVRLIASRQSVD